MNKCRYPSNPASPLTLHIAESPEEHKTIENMLMIIVGAVAGGLLILMLVVVITLTCHHKRKSKKLEKELTEKRYAEIA